MTSLAPFVALLRQTIGLDAASIGEPAVERAVRGQLAGSGMEPAAYLGHVRTSPAALQDLVEAVVVPETWFFRDREAFAALARIATDEWSQTRADRPLSFLSAPCSTGEEPFSMAMALLDAGLPPSRFQIDAVDISARALAAADHATYGRNAFRGSDLAFRERYFDVTPAGAVLNETVRRQVRFQQGNLFAPDFLAGAGPYDAVFCRNLLIYFDRETQDRCVGVVGRLMTADGVLFVGPSEAALLAHHFASLQVPRAFAFRKASAPAARPSPPVRRIPALPTPRRAAKPARRVAPAPPPVVLPGIEQAARLADQGRLAEAAAVCEAYVHRNGASAEAFYLMGLIHDAGGDLPEAERHYRKALYLAHHHQEALAHLALLLERQGKPEAARLLRERAKHAGDR